MTAWQAVLLAIMVSILWGVASQLVAPERLEERLRKENQQASVWVGEVRAKRMYRAAQRWVSPLFGPTGKLREQTPTASQLQATPFNAQISDIEPILTQAVFRILVMGYLLLLVTPFLVGAIVDGVVNRMKKREMYHSENPRVYHLAKTGMLAVLFAPIIIAVLPLSVAPVLAITWSAVIVITAWGMAQNVEQEI